MEVTAIVVARSGSIRVKNKNFLPFKETTLLGNKIEQLKLCNKVDRIVVGSDSDEYLKYSNSAGAEVVKRSDEFCDEVSKTPNDMIEDMCQKVDTDIILWAHCTNPFVDNQMYDDALEIFIERDVENYDSLMSMVELKTHIWHKVDGELVPMNYDPYGKVHPLAKTLDPIYYQDGAIFIQPHKQMLKNRYFFGKKPIHYMMPENRALDINTDYDYKVAKSIAEWRTK
tara:strand:+ start:748 stop:1428 length:681 start_codon:yes stop_codon:yes gene_type:complete